MLMNNFPHTDYYKQFIFNYVYVLVCVYEWISAEHQIPWEQELQVAASLQVWALGPELGSLARAVHAGNC